MKTFTFNNTSFTLGTNSDENWSLLSIAEKDHFWVHLDNFPSAHVIIHVDSPLSSEFEYARELILQQTKKAPRTAKIITVQVKFLKRGSKSGEVIISSKAPVQII